MFPTSPRRVHRHHHYQNYAWDYNYMHETSSSPHLTALDHIPLPLSKPALQTPTDLLSRVSALNRRATIVSASLAHLTAVVKPLETAKPEDLSENQLQDIWEEGVGLGMAMEEFREQMEEVSGGLEHLLGVKRTRESARRSKGIVGGGRRGRRGSGAGVGL